MSAKQSIREDDFTYLFSYIPSGGIHVLTYREHTRDLATVIADFEIACLETEYMRFFRQIIG